jgi:serine protease Do
MNLRSWIQQHFLSKLTRRLILPSLALALTAALVAYECVGPVAAKAAAAPAPPDAPLSADSVSPLLELDRAMEALAAHVTPAVVNVTVTSRSKPDPAAEQLPEGGAQQFGPFGRFFGNPFSGNPMQPQQPEIEHGLGSGVVISPDGYIVTNNHVVDGAEDIRVTTSDRRILKAKLIGSDPLTDLAVIKVDSANLPSVPWGDSSDVRPGQTVLAFGNPFGFRFTVTRGIVSAVNRPNPDPSDRRKPGEFIQTDAAINPGNSGGPLVDARGQVIGINTFLVSPSGSFSGMGFAIPVKIAKPTVENLIRYGKVNHGYIGIGINDVTPENSSFFHLTNNSGAVVSQVEPDSPGAKAGLRIGDVITEIDRQRVNDAGELQVAVGEKPPGTKIVLGVLRDGQETSVSVTLEDMNHTSEASANPGQNHGKARWGLGLEDLTPDLRQQLQAPTEIHGALIENIQPGSPADNAGLARGDVILEVNRHAVKSAADVQQALQDVPKGHDALVLVWSSGGNSFRVLHSPEGAS